MTFKQEYLHKNGPFSFNFSQQRESVKDKIKELILSFHPNEWNIRGFQPLSYYQSYKQIYGITSQQLIQVIIQFTNYLKDPKLTCQASIQIMKTLVAFKQYNINIQSLRVDNGYFINKLKTLIRYGAPYSLKNVDMYKQNLINVIKQYAKYGQQVYQQVMSLAIEERDIKYIAVFVKCIKQQTTAKMILKHIFEQSSMFERTTSFFYIIAQLIQKFPNLDINNHHQTLSQQIIKSITTIINPDSQQTLKQITNQDPFIGVQCTIKSVAKILVYSLKPINQPDWKKAWSYTERIFSIISGIVDHSHQIQSMNDFLIFIKQYVRSIQTRYRKQRGHHKIVNEDFVQEYTGPELPQKVIGDKYLDLFDQLMLPLVPQLLYLEDGDVRAAKILSDLAMFSPQKYLKYILEQIKNYLQKDLTIYSSYTPKMTILFLQQFVISKYHQQHEFSLMIQCCQLLLDALQKLGISQNLDILELIMRCYMYFPQNMPEQMRIVQNLTQDIIQIILNNMDAMSINLQNTEGEQAELYTDFKNIYFNFIVRLNNEQINNMCNKIIFKIKQKVPEHRQAYEFILVCLTFKEPDLSRKIMDALYKHIVSTHSEVQGKNGKDHNKPISTQIVQQVFPHHLNCVLATKNEQNLKWYSSIIQCVFQYNPQNIVTYWNKLETIIMLMLRSTDNSNIFDWGLDLLFNIIINLQHIHLNPIQFYKDSNRNYSTITNINWVHPSPQCISLLELIKNRFFDAISNYLYNRYNKVLSVSERAQKLKSQKSIQILFDRTEASVGPKPIQIKQFMNQILDCLLTPSIPSPQDIEQRKVINKLFSIQYSVFSAMQMRSCFTHNDDLFQIQTCFIKQLGCLRKQAIQHLKWMLQLFAHLNCLYQPTNIKLFHYFWREAHDQLYFSSGIQATNQKLHPFFYPTSFKNKQIFQNSFLIVTQSYLLFMMRIQLFSMLKPMAFLNNPDFLSYNVPFSYISSLDCSLKSYIPANIDPHSAYHFQILNICRLKLSLYHSNSYIKKSIVYSKAGNEGINKIQKQKYTGAIRVVINNLKRNMSIFTYPCCMRDEISWYSLQETLQISQYLQKKTDKAGIIQLIYLLIIFSFDYKAFHIYECDLRLVQKGQLNMSEADLQMQQKVVNYIRYLIDKINGQIIKKFYEKDTTVLVLLLICFSQFIPIQHPIFQVIIPLAFQITFKNNEDIMNIGKSLVFRILNRFVKLNTDIKTHENNIVKRKYEDFLVFRHVGGINKQGQNQPTINLITNKADNYYYPLKNLQYLYRLPLSEHKKNEQLLLKNITNEDTLRLIFKSLLLDSQLKTQQSEVDVTYLSEQEPKRIYSNGHKLINYIIDNNPRKMDLFQTFIDNFSNYPICFYHRLFRKMMILGGAQTINILKKIAKQYAKSTQKQEVKLCQFLLSQILSFSLSDDQFYQFYVNFLVTCSKQQFQFANSCLLVTFCIDWRVSKGIFNKIIRKLRAQKGPSRLRHLDVFNNYLLCCGRFAQQQAKDGIQYLMNGIEQGTDQVAQLIVSMLIYCFIIPINLNLLKQWVNQSLMELVQKNRIYKLDENTGYQINQSIRLIINQITTKIKQEKSFESKNLMVYSKIAYKVLSSITVHRFNDQFYRIFKQIILYIVNKPQEQGSFDQQIVSKFKDSEYPSHIYNDLLSQLNSMEGNTINVVKKKLKYMQSIVINKIFNKNQVNIPDIFPQNQKNVLIDHIIATSNMARVLKNNQLSSSVQSILKIEQKSNKHLNFMMAYLLAAGTRDFQWIQKILHQIIAFKKHKIVKQFVSYWWKGRNPETQKQQRLCMLVRGVQNPYSYFA